MIAVEVQHYLNRARDFLKGVELLGGDPDGYKYSSAMLGIHCAISYSDALRCGMGSAKLASDDHSRAADDLKSCLDDRRYDAEDARKGADRLRYLLGCKNKIAYGASKSGLDFGTIVKNALRFATWAENAGTVLRIEGWRNE